jgi:beta-lactam-binding protein with PASTA domain
MIKVPGVVGSSVTDAKAAIEGAGLKFRLITQYQRTSTPERVVVQDPRATIEKPQGSEVVVVVERNPIVVPLGNIVFSKDLVMKNEMIMQKAVLRAVPPAQPEKSTK